MILLLNRSRLFSSLISLTCKRNFGMHRAPQAMLNRPVPEGVTINNHRDPCTLSNYHNFKTTNTALDFHIDFENKVLEGNVSLRLKSLTEAETNEIVLDTSYLDISDVKVNGQSLKWDLLSSRVEPYGSPLSIKLKEGVPKDEHVQVDIKVSTTDKCTALQWLTPAQTSNGKHPYMFSQCQAIHARSVYPCMDTPDNKSTFNFRIRSRLPVVASGLVDGIEDVEGSDEKIYTFTQKVLMPSYLFAIASGDIKSAKIGPRSTVWTGPDELAGSKWELEQDTETFIKAAEKIVYDYAWGTYNVLVLPPSFPYGGMENPVYTFATPTIISGDRQNVDVIAHELAHSWSGNLVSNSDWQHFWLNEGWTVYLERRIQAAVHGEKFRDFSAIIGWKALSDSVDGYGHEHEYTKLVMDLKGVDPDDSFSSIPYEKGFTFLYSLEKLIGKEKWDKFIPHYFSTWKYKSLDSYDFKATLLDFFASDEASSKKLNNLDWDAIFYKPGMPEKPDFDTSMVDECYALATKWEELSKSKSSSSSLSFTPSSKDIESWVANQSVVFLEKLQTLSTPLHPSLIDTMDSTYHYSSSHNVELSSRFLVLGLKAGDKNMCQPAAELLGKVGRMKFVRPLYTHLAQIDKELAEKTFEKNKDFYHPICKAMIPKWIGKVGA